MRYNEQQQVEQAHSERCHPGFTHAAFTLGYEACLNKNTINGNDVPPGALISFIQKGVQYLEMETSVDQVRTPTHESSPIRVRPSRT